jgi:hypothetical protein
MSASSEVERQHPLSVNISAGGPEADMNLVFDSSARSWALPPPDLKVSRRLSIVNMELPRGGACEEISTRRLMPVGLSLVNGITLQHRTDMRDDVLSRERNDGRELEDVAAQRQSQELTADKSGAPRRR